MRLSRLLLAALLAIIPAAAAATEELPYTVVDTRMGFEIRRYPAYVVAQARVSGPFEQVGDDGFRLLHAYISGNNRPGQAPAPTQSAGTQDKPESGRKIAMTAPVIQAPVGSGGQDTYLIEFVMPSSHTLETLPQPVDPHVSLRLVPAKLIAAHRYSGRWTEANYRQHEKLLLDSVALAGVKAVGQPMYARYDPPFTPWFMRRNEVLVEVADPNVR